MKVLNNKKLVAAIILIIIGVAYRLFLKDVPNIEPITFIALIAGSILGGYYVICVPLIIIVLTDIYIGNDAILIYTWTAWAVMGFWGWLLRKRKKKVFRHSLELTGMGIVASCFFFIWTNFGVWQMWNMYPKTLAGLVQCYVAAIPFFRNSVLGNLVIVFVGSIMFLSAWNYSPYFKKYLRKVSGFTS